MRDIDVMVQEEEIRVRAKLNFGEDTANAISRLCNLEDRRSEISALLKMLLLEFLIARVHENLLNNPPGPEVILDAWTEDFFLDANRLKRGRGRPAHEALLHVFYMIGQWWTELPLEDEKKKRRKWNPKFYREADGSTEPLNEMADLFCTVARACDPSYTAANCSAVVDRARLIARSDASKRKRKELNLKHVARHRAKKSQKKNKLKRAEADRSSILRT
jgi:hypothetical protein